MSAATHTPKPCTRLRRPPPATDRSVAKRRTSDLFTEHPALAVHTTCADCSNGICLHSICITTSNRVPFPLESNDSAQTHPPYAPLSAVDVPPNPRPSLIPARTPHARSPHSADITRASAASLLLPQPSLPWATPGPRARHPSGPGPRRHQRQIAPAHAMQCTAPASRRCLALPASPDGRACVRARVLECLRAREPRP